MSAARDDRPYVRRHGWWLGGAVGVVVAVATGLGAQSYQEERQAADLAALDASLVGADDVPPPVDTIRDLLAQEGPLVVHPDLADDLDPAVVRRANALLERAGESPVRRVAYLPYPEGLNSGYTPFGALVQWMDGIGEEGHYVMVYEGGSTQVGALGLERKYLRHDSAKGQPNAALLRVARQVARWPAVPAEADDPRDGWRDVEDDYGGLGGGVVFGVLVSLVTVLPFFAVVRYLVGRRRNKEG